MSNILITGASGFIGSNLSRKLSESKDHISVIISKKSDLWRIRDVIHNFDVHVLDIANFDSTLQTIKKIKPDVVYHCATYGVYRTQKNLDKIIRTNINGSVRLMQALSEYGNLEKLINVGSSFEYGPKSGSIRESESVFPSTPYGIAKTAQTFFAKYFMIQNNLPVITMRIFTAYGKYEQPGRLISDTMLAVIRKKDLNLSSPSPQRDFVYIEDVVNALIKASKSSAIGHIFNIGNGRSYSIKEIIEIIGKIVDSPINVTYGKQKQHEFDMTINDGFANTEKTKKILHWQPKYSVQKGLLETYEWFKENIKLY